MSTTKEISHHHRVRCYGVLRVVCVHCSERLASLARGRGVSPEVPRAARAPGLTFLPAARAHARPTRGAAARAGGAAAYSRLPPARHLLAFEEKYRVTLHTRIRGWKMPRGLCHETCDTRQSVVQECRVETESVCPPASRANIWVGDSSIAAVVTQGPTGRSLPARQENRRGAPPRASNCELLISASPAIAGGRHGGQRDDGRDDRAGAEVGRPRQDFGRDGWRVGVRCGLLDGAALRGRHRNELK